MEGPRVAPTQTMEPVPATRVAPVSRRRNTRLVAGAGAVTLVAALVVGALVMMKGDASAGRSVTPAGDTASQSGGIASDSMRVSRRLDSLEGVASSTTVSRDAATSVLDELGRMQGHLRSDEQIVHAAVVRAFALSGRKENQAACRTLRDVEELASKTSYGKTVSNTIGLSCTQ
jgi:hypothetical protein